MLQVVHHTLVRAVIARCMADDDQWPAAIGGPKPQVGLAGMRDVPSLMHRGGDQGP
jgi:hypothetical protein